MEIARCMKLSEAGGFSNQDRAGSTDGAAWVLDGSGSLSETEIPPEKCHIHWFVDAWDGLLAERLPATGMAETLEKGMRLLKRVFSKRTEKTPIGPLDVPSAAIAAVQVRRGNLEYFLLGDCTLILKEAGGRLHYLKDSRVEPFDRAAADVIRRERPARPEGFSGEALEVLRRNRLLKNTEEGYPILEFDEGALSKGYRGTVPVEKGAEVILMTDGFSALIDRYGRYGSSDLFGQIRKRGLRSLYRELRAIERRDPGMDRYPRLKPHDDASIVYLEIKGAS